MVGEINEQNSHLNHKKTSRCMHIHNPILKLETDAIGIHSSSMAYYTTRVGIDFFSLVIIRYTVKF